MMRKAFLMGGILILLGAIAVAQQTTKKDGKPAKKVVAASQSATANPNLPQPSPEIEKLMTAMSGRFKVSGRIEDQNWVPGGDEGSGTEAVKRGPGGFTAISDAQMKFKKMGAMTGHGVMWWDPGKKAYQGFWCDSWALTCQASGEGRWEGDKLVFSGEMMEGPQPVPVRQTYSNFSPQGYDWSMETGDGKGNWKQEMNLKYRREAGKK